MAVPTTRMKRRASRLGPNKPEPALLPPEDEVDDPATEPLKKNRFAAWHRLHKQLASSPIILWGLGGLSLLLWLSATVVQIQTSEYLALGRTDRVATVAWGIISQPWLMISGQAPITVVTAWVYAWVVELITLVFGLALSVAVVKISTLNPHLGKWFVLGGGVLIVLNGWADYSASPGANWLVQFLIALAVGGIVVVGLPLGLGLIERGWEEFS